MGTIVRTETRKRGFFGTILKWVFIIFNLLMIWWLFSAMFSIGEIANRATSEAEHAGVGLGAALGFSYILITWAMGVVILGILVLLTRGKKIIVEETLG